VYEHAAPLALPVPGALLDDLASINDDRANILEGDEDVFDEAGGREASRASTREYAPLLQGACHNTPSLYAATAAAATAAESANSERWAVDARGPRAPSGSDDDAAVKRRPQKHSVTVRAGAGQAPASNHSLSVAQLFIMNLKLGSPVLLPLGLLSITLIGWGVVGVWDAKDYSPLQHTPGCQVSTLPGSPRSLQL
jgi:hypothetical protein